MKMNDEKFHLVRDYVFTVKEVSKILRMSESKVRELIKFKNISAFKFHGMWWISKKSVFKDRKE